MCDREMTRQEILDERNALLKERDRLREALGLGWYHLGFIIDKRGDEWPTWEVESANVVLRNMDQALNPYESKEVPDETNT